MGRSAKRTDPLHPRASRVEKARRVRTSLPSWYYRVLSLRWDHEGFRDYDPHDFDEDLSELEEQSEQEEDAEQSQPEENTEHLQGEADGAEECECDGEDPKCDCQPDDDDEIEDWDDDESEMSERSYDGSDADLYYDWKGQREERKREKLKEQTKKDERLEFEKSKEEEVRAAYKLLRKAEKKKNNTTPVRLSLSGEYFKLFCSDHVEHFYDSDFYAMKRVHFYRDHSDDVPDGPDVTKSKSDNEADMYGTVAFDGNVDFTFGPFRPPTYATWKPVKVKSIDGRHKLSFQFIGNGYLRLRVSRDMVFLGSDTHPEGPPTTAPPSFDFVGIWRDFEKEREEQERILAEKRARRSPSPRESWFEMNHPMGAWRSNSDLDWGYYLW